MVDAPGRLDLYVPDRNVLYRRSRALRSGHSLRETPGAAGKRTAQPLPSSGVLVFERQVLLLVAQGRSNAEIADLLVIAESTAKTHVKRVLAKVDAHNRAQAVVFAYRSGLLIDAAPT